MHRRGRLCSRSFGFFRQPKLIIMKLRNPRLLQLVPPLGHAVMSGVFGSCRCSIVNEEEEKKIVVQGRSILYTCWHGQLAYTFYHFRYRPRPVALLASPSFDGELIGRIAEKFGAIVFSGSRNKGGLTALKQIAGLMRQGNCGGIIADGSRGPYHQVQKGVVVLAREAGAPVLPVAVASERKITLNTWDRFELILPCSRVALLFGEPLYVPPEARGKGLEEFRLELETRLNNLFEVSQNFTFR
jgi:lysophospholipid acyltransferase (LPLAT)-like uncharacterized protein